MNVPEMLLPKDLPVAALAAQKRQWEKRIEEISKKEIILEENMKTLYSIIWGQVLDVLQRSRSTSITNYTLKSGFQLSITEKPSPGTTGGYIVFLPY